jgi:hypothetical protein
MFNKAGKLVCWAPEHRHCQYLALERQNLLLINFSFWGDVITVVQIS